LYPEAMLLTEAKAQEADLVSQLSKFRYLHFATHGLFSDVSPLQSAIVLAQPPKGSPDDGFLTAREIYALNLKADMAVLSACETARGEVKSGEGVVGLTWALFVAGVPTQVVSQWKVSDASTPELMTAFYGNLKAGQSKGQALRNAALTMMKDGKHSHPYHWAAFVLFGDWR
jgi:CHAT domain-containing protein